MFDALKNLFKDKPATPPARDVDALLREGKEHVRSGNWAGATRCYQQALAEGVDHVEAHVGLGFALVQQRQLPEAAASLQRAIALAPDNADAHYILGTVARDQGDRDAAITCFAKAFELQPQLVDACRDLSIAYFESGKTNLATETVRRGIAIHPASAEFRLILGNMLAQGGDPMGAMDAYQRGLSIDGTSPELHNNLGNVLRDLGQIGPATTSYRKALSFRPDYLDAHLNLARVMVREKSFDEALRHFEAAVTSAPALVDAYVGISGILQTQQKAERLLAFLQSALTRFPREPRLLYAQGTAFALLGKFDEAIASFEAAIELAPEAPSIHVELGNAWMNKGARDRATKAFEAAVRLAPAHPIRHMIAALAGKSPERASDEYVASVFDSYADNFDSHLVKVLKYNIPNEIAGLLRSFGSANIGAWSVLDLGCGTGLAGAAIGADAKRLVGVDLSSKMLEKAKARNLYERLECADLESMMRAEPPASFDVVVAADVFVYIGKLDALVEQAFRLLRPAGLLAFSVEALLPDKDKDGRIPDEELPDYRLNNTGRYTHSRAYVQRMASGYQFSVLELRSVQGRVNDGKPVEGYVAVLRK